MLEGLKNQHTILNARLKAFVARLGAINNKILKVSSIFLFLFLLNSFYWHVGIYEWMSERPCSVHSSAQCIRASVALNYYNVDMNFFKPRTQRYQYSGGINGIEFPIIYYTAAVGYKLFGFNDSYLKIISLLIVSLGIFFFYLLSKQFLRSTILSLLLVCSAIVSPVLLFYSANFMPDAPAFAFVLCSWYFFFQYLTTSKNKHLNLFVAFGALGALIKVISVMSFFVVFCLLVLDWLKFFKNGERDFLIQKRNKVFFRSLIGMGLVVAWYAYCRVLNSVYGNPPTLMQPVMVWDPETLKRVWHYAKNWIFDYYSTESYTLFVCALLLILFNIRRANRLLLTITVLYILGSLCYIVLFLFQFMHHDYYIIAMLPSVFFLLLCFFDLINNFSLKYSLLINVVFVIVVFFNVKEGVAKSRKIYTGRFEARVYLSADYRPYYDLEPRLRAMGIKREDKFAFAFDNSLSNPLYFTNQAGITISDEADHREITRELKAPDIKYLVLNDSARFNKVYPNHFDDIVLYHRGLIIYKIR